MLERYFKGITMPSKLFPNQIESANNLIYAFMNDEFSYAMLIALMQSGKTGVFMLVGAELIRLEFIDAFVVLCASADTELVDQLNNPEDFWISYRKYLHHEKHIDVDSVEEIAKDIKNKYSCLCGRKLNNSFVAQGKTLFITDESHYGQSCKQQLDAFYKKMGLQPDGSKSENGHLMLSVSATPFSEMIDNDRLKQNKHEEKMKVGSGYWGIKEMFDGNHIREFNKDHIARYIQDLVRSFNNGGPTIGWIRSRGKGNYQEIVEKMCRQYEVEFILYDQEYKEKRIEEVVKETKPMCIFLKNRMAMGKCLPGKNKTLWAIETNCSKLDTILQGLPGRFCGYASSGSGNHITIYLQRSTIKLIKDSLYEKVLSSEKKVHGDYKRAMNTKVSKTGNTLHPCIPEKAEINLNDYPWDGTTEDLKRIVCDCVTNSGFDTASINNAKYPGSLDKLKRDVADTRNITFSNIDEGTYIKNGHEERLEKYHNEEELMEETGSGSGWQTSTCPTIRVWHKGPIQSIQRMESPFVKLWLQFRADVPPPPGVFRYGTAKTTGKEIFQHRNSDGTVVYQNGSCSRGLDPKCSTDVSVMRKNIEDAINISNIESSLQSYNRISSEQSSTTSEVNGILVNDEVYKALLPRGQIYKYILERHEKKITIHKFNGRPPSNLPSWCKTRLSSISWE